MTAAGPMPPATVRIDTQDWEEPLVMPDGFTVHPAALHPDHVRLEDVANAMAHTPWNLGHTRRFYSMAQYVVELSRGVPLAYAPFTLLCQAGVGYVGLTHPSVAAIACPSLNEVMPIDDAIDMASETIMAKLLGAMPPDDFWAVICSARLHVAAALVRDGILGRGCLPAGLIPDSCQRRSLSAAASPSSARALWLEELEWCLSVTDGDRLAGRLPTDPRNSHRWLAAAPEAN